MTSTPRVRTASAADLADLVALEGRSFAEPWTPSMLAAELAHPDALVLVVRLPLGDCPAGYAAFRRAAGEAELLRLAVAPEARRRGLARSLVDAGLDRLRSEGVERCHLEVRDGNTPAIELYERLGFRLVGRRRSYFPDGADALLFSRLIG